MYRFVLLSVGFNLNMVYLYLTFSPHSHSVSQLFVLHYAGGGFQEEASIKPVCARMMVCGDLQTCPLGSCVLLSLFIRQCATWSVWHGLLSSMVKHCVPKKSFITPDPLFFFFSLSRFKMTITF